MKPAVIPTGIILLIIIVMCFICLGEVKCQPFVDTEWDTGNGHFIKYDKVEHFVLGIVTDNITMLLIKDKKNSFSWSIALQVLHEVKDVIWRWDSRTAQWWYKKTGFNPAGEGFCWKDAIASMTGVCFNRFILRPLIKLVF